MTATLVPERTGTSLSSRRTFRAVVAVTVAVVLASAVWTPPGWAIVVTVVGVVAVLGIPHGAVDHLAADAIDGRGGGRWNRRFVRDYVLAMSAVGLLWAANPSLALAVFLVASIHHFGQSDLGYLGLGRARRLLLYWSRGLLLVALPLVAHLEEIAPVVKALGGGDPASWTGLTAHRGWWCAALVVQHLVVGTAITRGLGDRSAALPEAITLLALVPLFVVAHPLIGFAVYFGLWHSLAHLHTLAGLLCSGERPLRSVYRLAAPLTAVSLAGLAAVVAVVAATGRSGVVVPAIFVFVSMVTIPHLLVVERMWRAPSAAP